MLFCFQSYLNSLKKKQKDVQSKYGKEGKIPQDDDGNDKSLNSDDSDLASLAREFAKEEIQDSPFLKRKTSEAGISMSSKAGSATPLPEQDAPFVNSLVKAKQEANRPKQTSSALNNFMRFNAKYDAKIQVQNNPPEESETDPESDVKKIASELEEKIRPGRRMSKEEKKMRRASLAAASEKSLNAVEEEERPTSSRLKKQAEERKLKLVIPGRCDTF